MSTRNEPLKVWIPASRSKDMRNVPAGWMEIMECMDERMLIRMPCGEIHDVDMAKYLVRCKNDGAIWENIDAVCIAEQLLCEGVL